MKKFYVAAILSLAAAAIFYGLLSPLFSSSACLKANLLGTTVEIKVYGRGARAAAQEALRSIEHTAKLINLFDPHSEISLINSMAGTAAVAISPTSFNIIQKALDFSSETRGCFDLTVGPLSDLWKDAIHSRQLPTPKNIDQVRWLVDYRLVDLDLKLQTVKLPTAGMKLDLGAIGKGYALDLAADLLKKRGIKSALLTCGSSIVTIGKAPDGKPWKIAVKNPRSKTGTEFLGYVELENQSLSISGDYEQFVELDGKRYCHIIDPLSGEPAQGVACTIVTAPTGTDADAYSTAVFVMGPKQGISFLDILRNIEGAIVDTEGKVQLSRSFKFASE